jgi:Sulfatase
MKILTHPAMLALGLAIFYLLVIIAPLVSPTHDAIYHLDGDIMPIVTVVFMTIAALWLLLTALLLPARKPGRLRIVIWSTIILSAPWVLLKSCAVLTQQRWHFLSIAVFSGTIAALFLLWFLWKPALLPHFERVQRLATPMIAFTALSGLLILGQLLWFTWLARDLNHARVLHQRHISSTTSVHKKTHVVWLLLDELSYQQVYEKRFPGLQLPAFDQLAAQSTVFTQTVPIANWTAIVVPSLMTGVKTDQVTASANGQLMLHNTATSHWQSFDPHQTVFEDALENGYGTAVAGWYNPYCRILASVIDQCFWSSHAFPIEPHFYSNRPFLENLFRPARRLFITTVSYLPNFAHEDADRTISAQLHIEDYKGIFTAADRFLADSSVDFLFLHLPVPHPEGIYDRKTSQLTTDGKSSYVDNLALADQYLAHLRLVLEEHGEWDSSAIVVMGDHSWRTRLAINTDGWTAEDEAASHGGQFDDRPGYIVKLPNQQKPAQIDDRFEAVRTRALLDGIITNRIKTPEDLAAWVRKQN